MIDRDRRLKCRAAITTNRQKSRLPNNMGVSAKVDLQQAILANL